MPTVLRAKGFRVVVYPPEREHGPPHVHVYRAEGEVVILLPIDGDIPRIRSATSMSNPTIVRAFRLVEDHADFLLREWSALHDA